MARQKFIPDSHEPLEKVIAFRMQLDCRQFTIYPPPLSGQKVGFTQYLERHMLVRDVFLATLVKHLWLNELPKIPQIFDSDAFRASTQVARVLKFDLSSFLHRFSLSNRISAGRAKMLNNSPFFMHCRQVHSALGIYVFSIYHALKRKGFKKTSKEQRDFLRRAYFNTRPALPSYNSLSDFKINWLRNKTDPTIPIDTLIAFTKLAERVGRDFESSTQIIKVEIGPENNINVDAPKNGYSEIYNDICKDFRNLCSQEIITCQYIDKDGEIKNIPAAAWRIEEASVLFDSCSYDGQQVLFDRNNLPLLAKCGLILDEPIPLPSVNDGFILPPVAERLSRNNEPQELHKVTSKQPNTHTANTSASNKPTKTRNKPSPKKQSAITALRELYPQGLPSKTQKTILHEVNNLLIKKGFSKISSGILRTAISEIKQSEIAEKQAK